MAVFAVHVVLSHDFVAVQFVPGDEVPGWAEGLVGAHCLVDAPAVVDEPVEVAPDDGEHVVPVGEVPDFTGTKPARRARK